MFRRKSGGLQCRIFCLMREDASQREHYLCEAYNALRYRCGQAVFGGS